MQCQCVNKTRRRASRLVQSSGGVNDLFLLKLKQLGGLGGKLEELEATCTC